MKHLYLILFLFCYYSSFAQDMVMIPAGEFIMGKDYDEPNSMTPAHTVYVDAFMMDKYEVTNAEYKLFCDETEHRLPEFWNTAIFRSGDDFPNHPVVGVAWADAKAYAEWAGKRLPTEAEWECAARGGLINKEYPNGNKWTKEKAKQTGGSWQNLLFPVGQDKANGFGLYDMGGNVWEWVADKYSPTYYVNSPSANPQGPAEGVGRVIRGGSWHSGAMCKRVYYRKNLSPGWCDFAVGFRCAKSISE
ncbi:formylglycine-generating enzyme family protein [Carboxylicivirga sp. N1Y90]|uniref:formylglycine-generating enzyme family protein n=1 Tax=Carboxylicivirga fragile TaxID=3417571 RepID=UPI003D33225F|nr:formylglycine-generating enzyme family protein [Marinilabiliaceae bacterium N1Y90]